MTEHLDKNGDWVLLVYALAAVALIMAIGFTLARSRKRREILDKLENSDD